MMRIPERNRRKPRPASRRHAQRRMLAARLWLILTLAVCTSASISAYAERADRDKPVNVEADSVEIDDQKKKAVFVGNVVLTQGTLMLKADRIVVVQGESGFQSGIAYGKPAYFRQKREGSDDFIEGEAERLEYDGEAEKVELFTNAKLKRGGDEVRGAYISYSALTEFFEVNSGDGSAAAPGSPRARVRAIIQPRSSGDEEASPTKPDANGPNGANR
jgi:lipopolysaccharide export system protein LptA